MQKILSNVGELRKALEGIPDGYEVRATGLEGPQVSIAGLATEDSDGRLVLFLEYRPRASSEAGAVAPEPLDVSIEAIGEG